MAEHLYFREDLLRTCRAVVFAARIPSDPQRWTDRQRGFMDFIAAFLYQFGYTVKDL